MRTSQRLPPASAATLSGDWRRLCWRHAWPPMRLLQMSATPPSAGCGVVLGHLTDSSETHSGSDRLRAPKPQSQQWRRGGGAGRHSGTGPRRAGVRRLTKSHNLHIVLGNHKLETVMTLRCRPLQVCVFRTACAAKLVAGHVPRASMRPIQHQPRQNVLRLSRAPFAGMRPRRRCCRLAAAPRCSRSWTRSASSSCGSRSVPSSSFH